MTAIPPILAPTEEYSIRLSQKKHHNFCFHHTQNAISVRKIQVTWGAVRVRCLIPGPLSVADKVGASLMKYLPSYNLDDAFSKLSARECQMAFQNWVAYGRVVTTDSSARENLTCPLLWCRHKFENLESCLQHVSTCQWLPNAWYWCPQCRRAELFTLEEADSTFPSSHPVRRKDSKLRRAVSFFKQIGRRGHSQQREATATAVSRNNETLVAMIDTKTHNADKEITDILSKPASVLDLSLFDGDCQPPVDRRKSDLTSGTFSRPPTLYDMEANALSPLRGVCDDSGDEQAAELATSDPLFNSAQLGDTMISEAPGSCQSDEMSERAIRFHPPSHYGPFSLSLCFRETEGIVSPISSSFALPNPVESRVMGLTSPISPLDIPLDSQWFAAGESNGDTEAGTGHCKAITRAAGSIDCKLPLRPNLSTEQVWTSTNLRSGEFSGPCWSLPTTSSEKLVEDLDVLVCGLHSHWAAQLAEGSITWQDQKDKQNPSQSTTVGQSCEKSFFHRFCGLSSFEAGLRALQQCFQGVPPVTLEGVFPIVQLAYACAYLLNDVKCSWHALFENALEWQNLIQCVEDRGLYNTIVRSLWDPLAPSNRLSQTVSGSENKVMAFPPIPVQESEGMDLDEENVLEEHATDSRHSSWMALSFASPESAWSDALKSGSVVRVCSNYLDGALVPRFKAPNVFCLTNIFFHSDRTHQHRFTTQASNFRASVDICTFSQ